MPNSFDSNNTAGDDAPKTDPSAATPMTTPLSPASSPDAGAGGAGDPSVPGQTPTQDLATGYAVVLPPSAVVGQAVTAVVVLTGGSKLAADLTVTLSDPAATTGGPATIAVGSTYGTTTLTPTSAGDHSVSASHTGGNSGMTDPAPTPISVAAASAGQGSGLTIDQVQAACAAALASTPVTVAKNNDKAGYGLAADPLAAVVAGNYAAGTAGYLIALLDGVATLDEVASKIASTPVTVAKNNDKAGYGLAADPLAAVVAGRYPAGTAGYLIASLDGVVTLDALGSTMATTIAATPVTIKAGSISASSFAPGASVPLPATPPAGYGGGSSSLTTAQVQSACAAAVSATPVTVGKSNDKTGYALAASGLDSLTVEGSITLRQALSVILATAAGTISGAGTGMITIKGARTTATRISAVTDNSGNRSAVQLSLPT